jgi:hypothetical protein
VPTLFFVQVGDEQSMLELARKKLDEDERHRGIEVWENGVRLFGLGTLARGNDMPSPAQARHP